jgi:[ribosomal protein S5]-alanine N-acetyltransferase
MEGISIESERFLLRSLAPRDVSERYRSWLNPETARMGIASASRQHTLEELREFIAQRVPREDVVFLGIFVRESGEHIGNIKYEPISRAEGYAVVGILIGERDWWGRGVTAEVLRATARWLCHHCGIREIVLGVMKTNLAARRSYEKVGFRVRQTDRIRIDPGIHEAMTWRLEEAAP